MGRRRIKNIDLPSRPVHLADFMLYHEGEIRRAVKEARADFSFFGSRKEFGGKGSGKKSDMTAGAAIKLAEELPAVVLPAGHTVRRPESWIGAFEAVKKSAKECNRPDWIAEVWRVQWTEPDEMAFVDSRLMGQWNNIVAWIRQEFLIAARAAELVSFSDDEIEADVYAAYIDPWDECRPADW